MPTDGEWVLIVVGSIIGVFLIIGIIYFIPKWKQEEDIYVEKYTAALEQGIENKEAHNRRRAASSEQVASARNATEQERYDEAFDDWRKSNRRRLAQLEVERVVREGHIDID